MYDICKAMLDYKNEPYFAILPVLTWPLPYAVWEREREGLRGSVARYLFLLSSGKIFDQTRIV